MDMMEEVQDFIYKGMDQSDAETAVSDDSTLYGKYTSYPSVVWF